MDSRQILPCILARSMQSNRLNMLVIMCFWELANQERSRQLSQRRERLNHSSDDSSDESSDESRGRTRTRGRRRPVKRRLFATQPASTPLMNGILTAITQLQAQNLELSSTIRTRMQSQPDDPVNLALGYLLDSLSLAISSVKTQMTSDFATITSQMTRMLNHIQSHAPSPETVEQILGPPARA